MRPVLKSTLNSNSCQRARQHWKPELRSRLPRRQQRLRPLNVFCEHPHLRIACSYFLQVEIMRRIPISIALFLVIAIWSSLRAQAPSVPPEDVPAPDAPRDLSSLSIPSSRRVEIEDAVGRHDFKRAETILVEESKRDQKPLEAAKLLEIAGGL